MRLLITYLTFGKDIFGGVERSLFNLLLGLLRLGHSPLVFTGQFACHFLGRGSVDGIPVFASSNLKRQFVEPAGDVDAAILANYAQKENEIESELQNIVTTFDPEFILAVDPLWGILPALPLWNRLHCPKGVLVHTSHNAQLLDRISTANSVKVFGVSSSLLGEIYKKTQLSRATTIHILPNSIVLSEFAPRNARNGNSRVIFCNSRISKEKGILHLLRAVERILSDYADTSLLLCAGDFHFGGNALELDVVRSHLRRHPSLDQRVQLLGPLRWSELPTFTSRAACVVLPTANETFGIAALEAMASRTPLIASEVGNLPSLIGDGGRLVPFGDSEAIAKNITDVFEGRYTSTMIEAGFAKACLYDYINIANHFVQLIR